MTDTPLIYAVVETPHGSMLSINGVVVWQHARQVGDTIHIGDGDPGPLHLTIDPTDFNGGAWRDYFSSPAQS